MGFLTPWALVALPLAVVPFLLAWRANRTQRTVDFSSTYLLDRARREAAPRAATRSRWIQVLRAMIIGAAVLAAARPVGPGSGGPADHFPTRAVVAVDVSASTGQLRNGVTAWMRIASWADTLLAAAGDDDDLVLAAVADGITGWWRGSPRVLRRRLTTLAPSARASDWDAVLEALSDRIEKGTESYLLTDGATGRDEPTIFRIAEDHRALLVVGGGAGANRSLMAARIVDDHRVSIAARDWESDRPVVAGRWIDGAIADPAPLPADASSGTASWSVPDTATFAIAGADPLPIDDRLFFARRGSGAAYRVTRWTPPDEAADPGGVFWEAALAALSGETGERHRTLRRTIDPAPDLAILPLRRYRADEARALSLAVESGARLLFVPQCADRACIPGGRWLPDPGPTVPALRWALGPETASAPLTTRPSGAVEDDALVSSHLLERAPIRPAVVPSGAAEWTWNVTSGAPILWVRGPVAVWLAPLGPPVTRIGPTPVFPLVVDAAMGRWDPRWARSRQAVVGESIDPGPRGGVVSGPVGGEAQRWDVSVGQPGPRVEVPGLYAIDGPEPRFVAVNIDPREGNLEPVAAEVWRRAWGAEPVDGSAWRGQLFPDRRGPELRRWLLVIVLAGLVLEGLVRRAPGRI